MLVLKGIFAGSSKITSENKNSFQGKKKKRKIAVWNENLPTGQF